MPSPQRQNVVVNGKDFQFSIPMLHEPARGTMAAT
jgi:hypothetical protein